MANTKAFIAAGLALVAVIFIFLGLFTRGWVTGGEEGVDIGYGLRDMEVSGGGFSMTMDLDEGEGEDAEDIDSAGLTAYIILWIAVLAGIGALVFAILGGIGKMGGKIGVILGFATGGLMILAVILYAVLTPEFDDSVGWGWAFYLVIVGGVLQCVGGGLMIGCRKEEGGGAPPPMGPPEPGFPAQPPEQPPW